MHISQGVSLCISEFSGWSWMPSALIGKNKSMLCTGHLRRLLEEQKNAHDNSKQSLLCAAERDSISIMSGSVGQQIKQMSSTAQKRTSWLASSDGFCAGINRDWRYLESFCLLKRFSSQNQGRTLFPFPVWPFMQYGGAPSRSIIPAKISTR